MDNAAAGFQLDEVPTYAQFYSLYPRKVDKLTGEKAWNTLTLEQRRLAIKHIPQHTAKWLSEGQERNFIPYPATWLRAHRWEDEIEIEAKTTSNWRQSEQGTAEMARKVGCPANPGEDYESWRKRIAMKLVRAA